MSSLNLNGNTSVMRLIFPFLMLLSSGTVAAQPGPSPTHFVWNSTGELLEVLAKNVDQNESGMAWEELWAACGPEELVEWGDFVDNVPDKAIPAMRILIEKMNSAQYQNTLRLVVGALETEGRRKFIIKPVFIAANLEALAKRSSPSDAMIIAEACLSLLKQISENYFEELESCGNAITSVADLLNVEQSNRVSLALVEYAENTGDFANFILTVRCATLWPKHLDGQRAGRIWQAAMNLVEDRSPRIEDSETSLEATLAVVIPLMDKNSSISAWESLMEIVKRNNNDNLHYFATRMLGLLMQRADEVAKDQFLKLLFSQLRTTTTIDNDVIEFTRLCEAVNKNARAQYFSSLVVLELNRQADGMPPMKPGIYAKLLQLVEDSQLLVQWMQHPGSIGNLRVALLRRLEEIEKYEGKPIFSELVAAWPAENREWSKLDEQAKSVWIARRDILPKRLFRTMIDAAQWLAKHRPDIDLEAPWDPNK